MFRSTPNFDSLVADVTFLGQFIKINGQAPLFIPSQLLQQETQLSVPMPKLKEPTQTQTLNIEKVAHATTLSEQKVTTILKLITKAIVSHITYPNTGRFITCAKRR